MYDPTARTRRNPLQSAREFIANDPLASRTTFSGNFQPVISDTQEPMSAIEAAVSDIEPVEDRLQETDQEAQNYNVRLEEVRRNRQRQIANRAEDTRLQQYSSGAGSTTSPQMGQMAGANLGNLSQSRQQVVRNTAGYAGTPYQLGGRTARGIDCSGLVMAVYNQAGFNVSQHSAGWQGRNIPGVRTSFNNLQPGDIVAWKDGSHIAIYAGNGMIWDASRSKGTSMRPLWTSQSNIYGIKLKFPGE
jgi:cell wall-associated NlpC family hydrolase